MTDHDSDDVLLALRLQPARLGARVRAHRQALFGDGASVIAIAPAATSEASAPAFVERGGDPIPCDAWPEPPAWRTGDRIVVAIADTDVARRSYLQWLRRIAAQPVSGTSLAPVGADAAGLHRLWCIAIARLLLPAGVRIEARHDRLGLRIAQIAIGLGADALTGPIAPDRALPLAGVTRPTEHTLQGLRTLVRQAGLRPVESASTTSSPSLTFPEASP